MLHSVEVKNYMLKKPVKLRPGMSVFEASHLILSNKISGAMVVDETGHLLGMVSELDCLRALLNGVYNDNEFVEGCVEDIMTKDVETADPHDDIVDVATSMLDHKHRRRPIVQDGIVVGQLSCRQILTAIKEFGGHIDPTEH